MDELASLVVHIEQFIMDNEKKRARQGRGPHLVSIIDMEEFDDDMSIDSTTNILIAEVLKRNSYSCLALRPGWSYI